MATPTKDEVIEAIRPVTDPEINISIVDLGLIYDVEVEEKTQQVTVHMTLTSPACPVGPQIMAACGPAGGVRQWVLFLAYP